MKSRFHIVGAGMLTAVVAFGLSGCSDTRTADNRQDIDTADRMSPREHDAQQSTGAASGPVGSANRVENRTIAAADRQWAMKSAQGGIAEVELGKMAEDKAASDQVKDFGKRMVKDHSDANDKLKAIAARNGLDLPAETDAKHKALADRLGKLSGAAFDRAYMSEMVKEHKHDVDHFRTGTNQLQDPDLKEFASSTLPTLQDHLSEAQRVANTLRRN
jgi:putative membrane protein